MPPKKSVTQKKNTTIENNEQMVLIRDETSQLLTVGAVSNVSSVKKGAKLVPGVTVTWKESSGQCWYGPILVIGTEAQCSKAMATIEKNIDNDGTVNSTNKEKYKLQSTITIGSPDIEHVQVDEDEANSNKSSPVHIVDEEQEEEEAEVTKNDLPLVETTNTSLVSGNSSGKKRLREEDTTDSISRKRHSNGSITVPYSTYSKKEQECLALDAELTRYKQEWMPRPKDPKVIQYLIEITDILRGAHRGEEDEDQGEILINIMAELKMTEKQLLECHRKSATATARHIMKFLFPIPTDDSKQFLKNELFVTALIKYTRISNPCDPTPDVDIRHAMGNYFAAYTFKNKKNNNISLNGGTEQISNNNSDGFNNN